MGEGSRKGERRGVGGEEMREERVIDGEGSGVIERLRCSGEGTSVGENVWMVFVRFGGVGEF